MTLIARVLSSFALVVAATTATAAPPWAEIPTIEIVVESGYHPSRIEIPVGKVAP